MLAVIAAASVAFGALVAAAFVAVAGGRAKRGRQGRARALRRGAIAGSIAGLLAVLRVIDGLTPITTAFVIVPFVLAEVVLSARAA